MKQAGARRTPPGVGSTETAPASIAGLRVTAAFYGTPFRIANDLMM
jgi:hypothetical protein